MVENVENVITPFEALIVNCKSHNCKLIRMVSFQILCKDQAEIDRYWDALVDGGEEQPCGWLRDRFHVSWQIFPTSLYDLLAEGDPARIERATAAVMSTFGKLDMAAIEAAADGA